MKRYLLLAHVKLKCIEIKRYEKLLEDVKIAESFINSANKETINNLSNPNRWLDYDELKYVNKMNGLY